MAEDKDPIPERVLPQSDLDLALMTTNPVWGEQYPVAKDNKEEEERSRLWMLLDFYTRDIRLSNYTGSEVKAVNHYLKLAGDLLHAGMYRAAQTCLNYVAAISEPSQARKGFLRKRLNTFTKENVNQELEPPKKKLFGGKDAGV